MPLPLELDHSSSIARSMAGEFVEAAAVGGSDADGASHQLARVLFAVGFFTMLLDLAAALYKEPSGVVFKSHKLAYYLTLAAIFTFGVVEVIVAFCLPRYYGSSERVRTLARILLFISVLPLVGVIALGGFAAVMRS